MSDTEYRSCQCDNPWTPWIHIPSGFGECYPPRETKGHDMGVRTEITETGFMPELDVFWEPGITREVYDQVVDGLFKPPWARGITREALIVSAHWRAIPSLERAEQMADAIAEATP